MKRSGIKRSSRRRIEALPRLVFHEQARGRCQACRNTHAVQAHHVVYAQELRRRGLGEWNTRNAMPLCAVCHEAHHNRSRPILLKWLTDDHLAYAFEALGPAAYDYLKRRYAGGDERIEAALNDQVAA